MQSMVYWMEKRRDEAENVLIILHVLQLLFEIIMIIIELNEFGNIIW